MPDIFKYLDYRKYLVDFFEQKKKVNSRYSLATFAARGQLGSRSYVSLIMDGKRNLGLNTVYKFGKALDLGDQELKYFLVLVSFNQAKTEREKEVFYASMKELKPQSSLYLDDERQERFFSNWRLPVLYTLIAGETKARSALWFQKHFRPKLKLTEIKNLIEELEVLGFLGQEEGGYVALSPFITSSDERASYALKNFHRSMIQMAHEAVSLPVEDREIGGVTLKVTKEDFEAIKLKLKELRNLCRDSETTDDSPKFVAQLNLQLFPISELIEKENL